MVRAQSDADDAGWSSAEEAARPDAEEVAGRGSVGDAGRGGAEDSARPEAGEGGLTGGAASERPAGQMEEEVPAPERTGARNEEAAAAAAAQTAPVNEVPALEMPVVEMTEMRAPVWLEDLREVAPNAAPGADGPFADIASTSEGGLGDGPSEGSGQGANWAIIQPEVPSDFVRAEREEDALGRHSLTSAPRSRSISLVPCSFSRR
ncbi:uncharacterized protein LOC120653369 [Panicum virgatum]|uniref:uncharacterized protein LOC120653369 n=1 Tax=Panicum virgatum TaxID=38727 RepID=UPI0019D61BFF|nr:uncharacterized protein LOC120653369 [Panicum virgatum]